MSAAIIARRALAQSTAELVRTNAPTLEHYKAVASALADVMTADVGTEIRLSIRIKTPKPQPKEK